MSTLKSKFHIVFQPKDRRFKKDGNRCKKFLISVNQLPSYLGDKNAATLIEMLKTSTEHSFKVDRFHKYGKLWIYGK